MAKISQYEEIPLDNLVIGQGQVRTHEVGAEIDELAASIKAQGLLQPIVVCKATNPEKWEILVGQRRFLAFKRLGLESITAAILDERVSPEIAKTISITENLIRRQLSGKDLTDGITYLYNHYGNIPAVVQATGLPDKAVRNHVKYKRLTPILKDMVDNNTVDIKVALKAQDSATENNVIDEQLAIRLAQEMAPMTGVQQKKFVESVGNNPGGPIDDAIEEAKSGARVTSLQITVTESVHLAIKKFASEENSNQDEAAASLVEEALVIRGLLKG